MKKIIAAAFVLIMIFALAAPVFAADGYSIDMSEVKIVGNDAGIGHVSIPEGSSYAGLWVRLTMCYERSDGTRYVDVYSVPAYKSFAFIYKDIDKLTMVSAMLTDSNSTDPGWGGKNLTDPIVVRA